jgi:uncharacterized protein YndB with AHSA1/START domain
MPKPYASGVVPADAGEVWRAIRDFNGLPSWHPALERSAIEPGPAAGEVGAVRSLTMAGGGGTVREQLVRLDDTDRSYTYDMLEGPFPLRSYRSTVRVAPITATGESFVEWWAVFDADAGDEAELNETFGKGVFAAGIAALPGYLAG